MNKKLILTLALVALSACQQQDGKKHSCPSKGCNNTSQVEKKVEAVLPKEETAKAPTIAPAIVSAPTVTQVTSAEEKVEAAL